MVFLSLWRPSRASELEAVVNGTQRGFNYPHVGATGEAPPLPPRVAEDRWWVVDHTRVKVGKGKDAYEEGKKALKSWRHFQLGWTSVNPSTPVQPGAKVCVVAQVLLAWTRNPLQILDVNESYRRLSIPEKYPSWGVSAKAPEVPARVFTFTHGCLGGHLLAGEERFALEWHKDDDSVWYEVYTFSRPAHPLSVVTYPLVRALQKRFAADSGAAMRAALADASGAAATGW